MKKISRWAQRHPVAARIIITISNLLLIANGLIAGLILFLNDWQHFNYTLLFLIVVFSLLFISYPKRGQKKGLFKYRYRTQKAHDFGLVTLSFLMICVGSNNWLVKNVGTEMTVVPTATFIVHKHKKPSKRQFKKQLRKQLRVLKKDFKKRKNRKMITIIRILLTLLLLGVAAVLGYLIVILSCNLYCSSSGGLATLVFVGGIGGIGVLVGLINRKIWYKNPRYQASGN